MALIVQKYGGTSVGDVERIQGVARRVARYKEAGHDVVVVVSAMSGETNRLMAMGQQIGGGQTSAKGTRRAVVIGRASHDRAVEHGAYATRCKR